MKRFASSVLGLLLFATASAPAQDPVKVDPGNHKVEIALVGSGSMPLTLLEEHIDWFIAQEKSGPALAERDRGVQR